MGNPNQATQERRKRKRPRREYVAGVVEKFNTLPPEVKGAMGWPLFETGQFKVDPHVEKQLAPEEVRDAIMRHGFCDWGTVCKRRVKRNMEALDGSGSLVSRYHSAHGLPFLVITNRDRS